MEKFPKPVSKYCTKKIFEQMENSYYKIKNKNNTFVFGFFCYVKNENVNIPVLITDKQIINNISDNTIEIIIKNENKRIELGKILFKNKSDNIAIIEVKENNIKFINFLDLDERIYKKKFELFFGDESIYIINYSADNKDVSVSYGTINNINNSEIIYSCNINSKTKLCPIFNLSNNKIIGIHQCFSRYYNKGIFLNNIINEFINYYKIKKNQELRLIKFKHIKEIHILIEVKEYKHNEKIFFLNSNEFNENNTELFINNLNYKYKKSFIPKEKGEYNITLKFNFNIKDCRYMFA